MQYVPTFMRRRFIELQPDKDELVMEQQLVTLFPTAFAILTSALQALLFYVAGVPALALASLVMAIWMAGCYTAAFVRPQLTEIAVVSVGVGLIACNFYMHAAAGGFSSGIWPLAWLMLMPLVIYFSAGQREGVFVLALSLVAITTATLLDSTFAQSPLSIPHWMLLLYNFHVISVITIISFVWAKFLIDQLDAARGQTDALLLNILPAPIATRLKHGEAIIADQCDAATILFADIVDFTTMSADADPVDVVAKLNDVFSSFDELAAKHGLEKIKTIGDAYMVAGGLPEPRADHVTAVAAFAIDMLEATKQHQSWTGEPIGLRVGINTGPVVAGVIGRQKFIYDLWGDAVNVASRMESNGLVNVIQVTETVRQALGDQYTFEEREPIYVKGKGMMVTYLLQPGG